MWSRDESSEAIFWTSWNIRNPTAARQCLCVVRREKIPERLLAACGDEVLAATTLDRLPHHRSAPIDPAQSCRLRQDDEGEMPTASSTKRASPGVVKADPNSGRLTDEP